MIRNYADFKCGDLFTLVNPKGKLTTKQLISGNDIPYVAAKKTNNGVAKMCSCQNIPDDDVMIGNCIVFIQQGDGSAGYTTYQPDPFYAISCVCCGYNDNLDELTGLYLVTLLDKNKQLYSHSYSWNTQRIKDTVITLPIVPTVTSDTATLNDIDWNYMRNYIKKLEYDCIKKFDTYLKETELDDCTLTQEDENVLERGKMSDGEECKRFVGFRLGDVVPPVKVRKYARKPTSEGNVPFISCQSTNNGVACYCGEKPEVQHCITVSTNGNCFDCFWHDEPIIPSCDVEVLTKDGITDNREISLYLCTVLSPFTQLYSYSNKPKNGKVFDTIIQLPIIDSVASETATINDIDWNFMVHYVRAIEKQVLRDVVEQKDKMVNICMESPACT